LLNRSLFYSWIELNFVHEHISILIDHEHNPSLVMNKILFWWWTSWLEVYFIHENNLVELIVYITTNKIQNLIWCAPKLFKRPKGGVQSEIMEEKDSWGMLPNSQHFGGRRVCWSSEIKLGWTHKQKFKMRSTCIIKKRVVSASWIEVVWWI